MRTIPQLTTAAEWAEYHRFLQSDHDYRVWADVITMEETFVASVDILDGQVNVNQTTDGSPERTGSLILSDPEGALDFGGSYSSDDYGVLWVNRLVRINHSVTVPSLGDIRTVVMVGTATAASRSGAEIALELADKSLLANHGVRPRSFKKGANGFEVIRILLRDICGERHLRIPNQTKKLSKPYSTGMGENEVTPWVLAQRIATRELGGRLFYSADGFATFEANNVARNTVEIECLLGLPDASVPFTEFSNYSKVTSKRQVEKKSKTGKKTTKFTTTFEGVASLPKTHPLSEQSLARNGAVRTLPIVTGDDNLDSKKKVSDRAIAQLRDASDLTSERAFDLIPMFHLDVSDILEMPMGIGRVQFNRVSIPLGVGSGMSVGHVQWVSRPVTVRAAKVTKTKKKVKGGKSKKK